MRARVRAQARAGAHDEVLVRLALAVLGRADAEERDHVLRREARGRRAVLAQAPHELRLAEPRGHGDGGLARRGLGVDELHGDGQAVRAPHGEDDDAEGAARRRRQLLRQRRVEEQVIELEGEGEGRRRLRG
jgi:hypothetical protein